MKYDLEHLLWYCSIAAEFGVILRLLTTGIARHYRWFTLYLTASLIRSIALLIISSAGAPYATNAYGYTWAITEPVMLALVAAFSLEAYGNVHRYYPGFDDDLRRPIIHPILIAAGVVCILSLIPYLKSSQWQPTLSLLFVLKRSVTAIAAMVLGLVWAAYAFMPVLMPNNVMRHVRLAFLYCSSNAIGYFGLDVWRGIRHTWAHVIMVESAILFALWAILLSRAGEILPSPDSTGYDPAFEDYWNWLVRGTPPPESESRPDGEL